MSRLKMATTGVAVLVALDAGLAVAGAVLTVGPGRQFDKPYEFAE